MNYREHFVQRNQHKIYVRDYSGEEPAIILMHGFPDNLHLYDRLVPHLSPQRRVVAFDFLGWGASDKPSDYSHEGCSCGARRLRPAGDRLGPHSTRAGRGACASEHILLHDADAPSS